MGTIDIDICTWSLGHDGMIALGIGVYLGISSSMRNEHGQNSNIYKKWK